MLRPRSFFLLSGRRLKAGYIAAEFIGVEDLPHRRLKASELSPLERERACTYALPMVSVRDS
jgi:hypothetical protein